MTGPDGDSHGAPAVDPPISLEFTDAFTDADGTPVADMPVNTVTVQLTEREGGTRGRCARHSIVPQGHGAVGEHRHA